MTLNAEKMAQVRVLAKTNQKSRAGSIWAHMHNQRGCRFRTGRVRGGSHYND